MWTHGATIGALRWALLGAVALLLAGAGCATNEPAAETQAAACADGRDNDEDGAIDCADPDCAHLAFCSPHDTGPHKPPPDAAKAPDLPRDTGTLDGPTPPPTYGARCQFKDKGALCSDGVTTCVPGKLGMPGLCTVPCPSAGPCPPGPDATPASCLYAIKYDDGEVVWYCVLTCAGGASCPNGTECVGSGICL